MRSEVPNPAIIIIEKIRSKPEDIPLILTIVERNKVKNVKLAINPSTIPIGRDRPVSFPPIVEERIIGRMGKIHGDKIVIIPAKNANRSNKIILTLF